MTRYALLVLAFALAAALPDLVGRIAGNLRMILMPLALRPGLAALVCAAVPVSLRLLLLGRWPIPLPKIPDEFSYLFQADVFASGRLATPVHPQWRFFEAPYLLFQPVTASKYPPGQALVLAAGQSLLGDPWYGVCLSCGAMAAAFYWMLLGFVPRIWALAGGLWVAVYAALLSDAMNSYWGGAVAGCGGALLIGAAARLLRPGAASGWLGACYGAAWVILANTRPYEGAVLLAIPLTAYLCWKVRPPRNVLGAALVPLALGALWMAAHNRAVTGSAFQLPYQLHDQQYAYVGPFWWQATKPKPTYRLPVMEHTFTYDELRLAELRSGDFRRRLEDWDKTLRFLGPYPVLACGLVGLAVAWRRRRYRSAVWLLAIGAVGLNLTVFQFAHYAAPFGCVAMLLMVLGARSMAGHRRLGAAVLAAVVCFGAWEVLSSLRRAGPGGLYQPHLRAVIERHLEQDLDQHLIFVTHPRNLQGIQPSWAYNRASVDDAKTVWANDLGDSENQKLLGYYPSRIAWRLDLDDRSLTLQPYRGRPGQSPVPFLNPTP